MIKKLKMKEQSYYSSDKYKSFSLLFMQKKKVKFNRIMKRVIDLFGVYIM